MDTETHLELIQNKFPSPIIVVVTPTDPRIYQEDHSPDDVDKYFDDEELSGDLASKYKLRKLIINVLKSLTIHYRYICLSSIQLLNNY